MARKLKTYQTSLGFFDLAIAAPSMKAALDAWGADSNLFRQGAAKESDDPDVIAATMAKPGLVLKRPVGSTGSFGEQAALPTNLGDGQRQKAAGQPKGLKAKIPPPPPVDKAVEKQASLAFEREQERREREQAKEEAARQKERERRQKAVDKAQAAMDEAKQEHTEKALAIEAEVAALEKKLLDEELRWNGERERLEAVLRRARG